MFVREIWRKLERKRESFCVFLRIMTRGGNLGFLMALVVMVKEIKFKAVRHMLVYLARL